MVFFLLFLQTRSRSTPAKAARKILFLQVNPGGQPRRKDRISETSNLKLSDYFQRFKKKKIYYIDISYFK
jgi:hypothetical protein